MNKQKSFTLIELLVVIVIIGILAGVIMISTSSSIDKANIAKSKVFEESVQNNLAANMVSAWDADHVTKSTTWLLDDKWGNNNGTFYDNTSTACTTSLCPQIVTDNQMGNVLSFDGTNDYIKIPTKVIVDNSEEYTLSSWFYCKDTGGGTDGREFIFESYPQYTFNQFIRTDAKFQTDVLYGDITGISLISNSTISLNKWYNAVTVFKKNNKLKFFLNGIFDKELDTSDLGTYPISGLNIGTYRGSNDRWFSGFINNIKIYNEALASSQIKQNYIAGLNFMLANGNISKEEYNQRIQTLGLIL